MQLPKITIDFENSHGSYVVDKHSGKKYLDMHNHYSSLPLGYNHPVFKTKQFQEEILRVAGTKIADGRYNSEEMIQFSASFFNFAAPKGFNFVHYACTGSLAVEAAIKTAWAYQDAKNEPGTFIRDILVPSGNFHGINSFGNFLSTTDRVFNEMKLCEGDGYGCFSFAEIKPLQFFAKQIKSFVKSDRNHDAFGAAAIIIEPIQCTSGDIKADIVDLKEIRDYCTHYDIPLIFDEIQTGFGTTGKVWYWQHLGIEPDIIVFGKKAQVSGILVKDEFSAIFNQRDKLSVTFDGDLVDMIRCKYIIQAIKKDELLQNIDRAGKKLIENLFKIEHIRNIRGTGGLIAFDFDTQQERDNFCRKAFKNGLIVNPTAEKSVRLRPNLAITGHEIFNFTDIVIKTIFELYL